MASPHTTEPCPEQSISVANETYQGTELVQRGQWIRAAILGANDGLLSTTSLMLGIGAANDDKWSMILSGVAGAIAGACSMAVGEFVSVSTQRDIEQASKTDTGMQNDDDDHDKENALPNPCKAASASALSFLCGAVVPLASAAFIEQHVIRIVVIAVVSSIALAVFGCFGACLGGSPVRISAARVLFGGWVAMAITYGLLKPFDRYHHGSDTD
ncbi:vacuolar iron transporter homolog 2-like [Gossypium arboreum]|uniref:vacuolar iron transporter homolog 2-like n=1 Tax=Gossypium arboreum TaxID=29729 RepID=UPI00081952E2|nr:vacuolar iron transporter homolog 2-like [Gossypium arboreum]